MGQINCFRPHRFQRHIDKGKTYDANTDFHTKRIVPCRIQRQGHTRPAKIV
jgi:hypothetical protein